MMKKRILAIGLAALMLMLTTACGGKGSADTAESSTEAASSEAAEVSQDAPEESAGADDGEASADYGDPLITEEPAEAPELTYKMAPIYVQEEPTEYGYTHSNYVIVVNEPDFTFWDVTIFDKSTGEACGWDNDYDWSGYPGKICTEEKAHYGALRSDGWFDYWATDRATYVVTIEHKGDVLGAENVQVVAEMEYQGQQAGEYTFEVNAELDEIPTNECAVVHGFNLLKFGDEYYIPEINSSAAAGTYDYDTNSRCDGWGYTFIHLTGGETDPEAFRNSFRPMRWDDGSKSFVPYETPAGYEPWNSVDADGGNLEVYLGLSTDMDGDVPYELIEEIVPAYDDGVTQMVFSW